MFLGIDLGTSGVKALLVDEAQAVIGSRTVPLTVQRPHPGHSEQDPAAWWQAVLDAVDGLRRDHPAAVSAVQGIGLSGQMHGAVLLDQGGAVLRPAILWNDVRAVAECRTLEERIPALHTVTGNLAMPGFTAPKLIWVQRHEPALFQQVTTVLLPKAWLRYRLCGEMIEEMSDASGTLWLDVGARDWSDAALGACGLSRAAMPRLCEGNAPAGRLQADLAMRWGMARAPVVAGGGGDNAAGAIGLGAIRAGEGFVSLGTSGVVFAVTERFRPWPQQAVHAFCHALPETWHQMAVTLSAASCLSWWAGVTGRTEGELLAELPDLPRPSRYLFLPFLGGERTPYNNAGLRAGFVGLDHDADRPALTRAVLEGVAFSLRDGLDALTASGTILGDAAVIGGGSRSHVWTQIIAAAMGIVLHSVPSGEHGAAFGACRLARMAATGEAAESVCTRMAPEAVITPDAELVPAYQDRLQMYHSAVASQAER